MVKKAKIFPQANDFEKIIRLIKVEDEKLLSNFLFLKELIEVSSIRQVDYYLSACFFLDIINEDNEFTYEGKLLRNAGRAEFVILLSMKIVSKPIFGNVFFYNYLYKRVLASDEIAQLILMYDEVNSLEVAKRRSSTVIGWLKWIEKNNYNQTNLLV